jgi:hypothetical protein
MNQAMKNQMKDLATQRRKIEEEKTKAKFKSFKMNTINQQTGQDHS